MNIKVLKNQPLLELLKEHFPDSSKTTFRSWIEEGRIRLDGTAVTSAQIQITPGQEVVVGPKTRWLKEGIKVLYEDDDLIVIDKPEGLLTVAADNSLDHHVHGLLKSRFRNRAVFPAHRLDRDTSGILVFAYNRDVWMELKKQFEAHTVERVYYALVVGAPPSKEGTWKSFLHEDERFFVKSASQGKLAITHYKVIDTNERLALMQFKLETGRKNQIRVHCKDAGCPILGDTKYGDPLDKAPRLFLHASHLGFWHPTKEKQLSFDSELPISFRKKIQKTKK